MTANEDGGRASRQRWRSPVATKGRAAAAVPSTGTTIQWCVELAAAAPTAATGAPPLHLEYLLADGVEEHRGAGVSTQGECRAPFQARGDGVRPAHLACVEARRVQRQGVPLCVRPKIDATCQTGSAEQG